MALYTLDSPFVRDLDSEIMALIAEGVDAGDTERFNDLARREFIFQYQANEVYRGFCAGRGVTPESVVTFEDIPPLPVRYFKEQVISSIPLERAKLQYMSSGTSDPNLRTRVHRDERCSEMVLAANRQATKAYLFPDVERLPVLLFVPSPEVAPFMGMAVGLTMMKDTFGTAESRYLIGPDGFDTRALYRALFKAEETGRPVALIGATSGFVFLFNQLSQQNLRFTLPPGSRISDGGGYMGTFGECSREEYLAMCAEYLGVSAEFCVNTLGMAECGQNYLDNVLRAKVQGRPTPVRYKPALPWTRVMAVDPATGARVPKGERGWFCHYDLTNRASVIGVLTDNVGYEVEDGFEILGRAEGVPSEVPAGHAAAMAALMGKLPGNCSTVADGMLAGRGTPCSTVADAMLSGQGTPCSTVADQMLANPCQTVAERMIAAGAPNFAVEMVKRRLAAGESVSHPFGVSPGGQTGEPAGKR